MFTPIVYALLFAAAFGDRLARWIGGTAYNPDPFQVTNLSYLVLTGGIGFMVGYGIAKAIGKTLPSTWTLKESIRLVSFQDTNEKGIFLSRGAYYYTYRKELGRVSSSVGSLSVDKDILVKVGEEGSWMETYVDKLVNDRHAFFAIPSNTRRYEFLLPKGNGSMVCTQHPNQGKVINKAMA